MMSVWTACAAFVLFVGGVKGMQARFTVRPGEYRCPRCGARMPADLTSVGDHLKAQHGIERAPN